MAHIALQCSQHSPPSCSLLTNLDYMTLKLNIVTISKGLEGLYSTLESVDLFIRHCQVSVNYTIVLDRNTPLSLPKLSSFSSLASVRVIHQHTIGISNAFNSALVHLDLNSHTLFLNSGDTIFDPTNLSYHSNLFKALLEHRSSLVVAKTILHPRTHMPPRYVAMAYKHFRAPFILARIPHQSSFIPPLISGLKYDENLMVRMDYSMFYILHVTRKIDTVLIDSQFSIMQPGGCSSQWITGYLEELRIHSAHDKYPVLHQIRIYITILFKTISQLAASLFF